MGKKKVMAKRSKQQRGGVPPNSTAAGDTPPPSEAATDPSGGEEETAAMEDEKVVDCGDSSPKPSGVEEMESPDEAAAETATEEPNEEIIVEAEEAEKLVDSESGSVRVGLGNSSSNAEGDRREEGEGKATVAVVDLEATEEAAGEGRAANGAVPEKLKKEHNGGGSEGEGDGDEGELVGDALDDDPQITLIDTAVVGAEGRLDERKTFVGEMEESTEIEEMEVLGQHDSPDAKDDDMVGEDDEKYKKEENKKDIEEGIGEDSDGESEEDDDDLCKYTYEFLTNCRKEKNIEIFVGGIGKGTAEEDLINVFGKFGELKSTRIVKNQTTKKSKGFAFIQYATLEQSKNVLSQLKDGIEVRGNRVKISASQDKDTLFMGNICKKWTKENVSEALRGYGIEQIVHIHLPEDDTKEGRIKGFAFLEFSTHSDALAAFQRLIKPDAVFGRNISAKVSFAQIPMHPSEEAQSKVEANIAKPRYKDQLQKQGIHGGFKVKYEGGKLVESGSFKAKTGSKKVKAGSFKKKGGSSIVEARSSKKNGRVNNKGKSNENYISRGHDIGTSSKQEKRNHKRKNVPIKADDGHGEDDNGYEYERKPKKKLRGNNNIQGRQSNTSRNRRSYPRLRDGHFSGASSVSYGNQYAWRHATPSSSINPVRSYTAISRAEIHQPDMEPHAGYLEPTVGQQAPTYAGYREPVHRMQGPPHAEYLKPAAGVLGNHVHDYVMRSASGYDDEGIRGAPYVGSGRQHPYVESYAGHVAYEAGGSHRHRHRHYSNIGYPRGRAYPRAKPH